MASDKKMLRKAAKALERIRDESLHAYASREDQMAIMHGSKVASLIRSHLREPK